MPLPWSMVTTTPHAVVFHREHRARADRFDSIALFCCKVNPVVHTPITHGFGFYHFAVAEIFVDFCSQRQHEIFRLRLPFCRGGCLLLLRSPLVGHAGCRHVCGRLLRLHRRLCRAGLYL